MPVCLYAGSLVPAEVLAHCPPGASLVDTAELTLDEIIAAMAAADAEGLDVARLRSGDPSVFSAVAEQMRRLDAAGIGYDVIPGVPAFAAAAAALRRELTVPTVGQTVILTRIAHRATPMPPGEDLATWPPRRDPGAAPGRPAGRAGDRGAHPALRAGLPGRGGRLRQPGTEVILRGTLGDIAPQVHDAGIKRTAVIIVGRVLAAEGFRDSHLYSAARERSAR